MNAEQLLALLKKYVAHVQDEEGVTFLEGRWSMAWTDEEWAVLQAIQDEVGYK